MPQDPASPKVWNISWEAANIPFIPAFYSDLGVREGRVEGKKKKNLVLLSFGLSKYKNQQNNSRTYITEYVKVKQEMPTKIENNVFFCGHNRYSDSEFFNARFLVRNYTESCII